MSPLRSTAPPEVVRMLEKVPMFSRLSDRQLRGLTRDAKERTYAEGSVIVKQGDVGAGFYLLLDGRVDVRRKGRRLATLEVGQFFGEMALFDEQPRSADVVAAAPTRCLILTKWAFWAFATGQPAVLRDILQEMARRLSETNRSLTE